MPMDATAKRSYEIQAQVRHNAEDFRNTLNDLYNWEKEIKGKEQNLQQRVPTTEEEQLKTLPVRSHIQATQQANKQTPVASAVAMDEPVPSSSTTPVTTPTEKREAPLDANEEKRKQANDIKDRGNKCVKLGEYEKAIYEYTTAIDVFPEDPIFYSNRALCYLKLERYNECIEDCERAIEIDSLAVKAYYRRMQANECLGNNLDALKDCTAVLMVEPKNSEAQKSLERINERLRKNVKTSKGPNFTALRDNMVDILPIDKPPYKRSNKPLQRVSVVDIVGPKNNGDNLKISDDDIDKLFNSNCGPFVEVKKGSETSVSTAAKKESVGKSASKNTPAVEKSNDVEPSSVIDANKLSETAHQSVAATVVEKQENIEIAGPATAKADTNKLEKVQKKSANGATKTKVSIGDSNEITPAIADAKKTDAANNEVLQLKSNRPLPPAPTSTAQFYSNWKELSRAQKYHYLKSIELPQLGKVLGAGFDSDTLTDVLRTLHDYYLPNNESKTAATLLEVSKNNQVTILSLLMSAEERKVLSEILNKIRESQSNTSVAGQIARNFNLH